MLTNPEWTQRLTPVTPHALTKVRQLYLALYEAITRGELVNGQSLPASRQLSIQLGVGRNTVIAVYAQLTDEGLISSSGRRGTTVTYKAASAALSASLSSAEPSSTPPAALRLSARSIHSAVDGTWQPELAPGMPDAALFPKDAWRKALLVASRLPANELGYNSRPLRRLQSAISRYLTSYRSLRVKPEQIIITSSTRQSLALAASLYADPGDHAWVETPGYRGAMEAFSLQGLQVHGLKVTATGHVLKDIVSNPRPSLLYLTPCFQYPTGLPLSAVQRTQIMELARQSGAVIFEDDYDSEFRDNSQARPALASQANDQTNGQSSDIVLHAGTFSKLIFPAARIAWMVVPELHVDSAHHCLRMLGGSHNSVAQATVAELLDNGTVARHLQRARGIYAQRRHVLIDALNNTGRFESLPTTGGSLSLVVPLKKPVPAKVCMSCLTRHGVGAQLLESLSWNKPIPTKSRALVLGLGNVSSLKIPSSVDRLVAALDESVHS